MSSTTTAIPDEQVYPVPAEDERRPGPSVGRKEGRLAGADGMRALAALGVVFSHLFQRLSMGDQPDWLLAVQGVMMKGAYGVSIFFVLSGMLLSLPFWKAYLTGGDYPRIGHYVRRRAARIVPGYYASLIISFLVGLLIFPNTLKPVVRLVAGLAFVSGFRDLTFFPTEANGPLWSISLEVFSYVLMPLAMLGMFALGRRRKKRAGKGFAPVYWVAMFVVVLALNQRVISTFTTSDNGKGWQYGSVGGAKEWLPWYNPVGFFAHFCVGIVTAGVIAWWQVRHGGRRWWFDLVALAGILGLGALVWTARFPLEPGFMGNFQNQPYLFPALALCAGVALVGLSQSRFVARAWDNPFARFTAKVSFGIYIWHYLLLHLLSYLTGHEFEYGGVHDPIRFAWISGTLLVLAYAVASASWFWLERPVLNSKWART